MPNFFNGWVAAVKASEMALATQQVLSLRAMRFLTPESSHGAHRQELNLMGREKVQALGESVNAMVFQMVRANQSHMLSAAGHWWRICINAWLQPNNWSQSVATAPIKFMRSLTSPTAQRNVQNSMLKVVEKGLVPVRKRVTRNVKRLSRKK